MSNYAEKHLMRNETVVQKAKKSTVGVIFHITNIFIIPLIVRIIKYCNMELAITSRRLVGKVGVLKTASVDMPLNKVQNADVKQGFIGKILNYGSIGFASAGTTLWFPYIKNPNGFKTAIFAQQDAYEEERIKQQAMETASAMASALKK